jgi:hypothetical protein
MDKLVDPKDGKFDAGDWLLKYKGFLPVPIRNWPDPTVTIHLLNQTTMDHTQYGSAQKNPKGTRATGFKPPPRRATLSC